MSPSDGELGQVSPLEPEELAEIPSLHPRIRARRVLALEGSPRLAGFLAQPLGPTFEVHPAIDGRGHRGAALRHSFDYERCVQLTGFRASGPEMGCALGHAQIIVDFAHEEGAPDDFILVAEDDARLSNDFPEALNHIIDNTLSLEYMILADPFGQAGHTPQFGHSSNSLSLPWTAPRFRAPSGTTYRWGHAVGDHYGTGLYLVSRNGAQKFADLLGRLGRVHWIADDYRYWAAEAGIRLHYVRPNLAGWEGESTVQSEAASQHNRTGTSRLRTFAKNVRSLVRQSMRGGAATLRELRHPEER